MIRFVTLPALLASVLFSVLPGRAEGLALSVSVQQQDIVAPNPVRVLLRFHNSGQHTIWLYRPVGSASAVTSTNPFEIAAEEASLAQAPGGSDLEVHLAPINSPAPGEGGLAAHAAVIVPGDFPQPRVISLAPGREYTEQVAIHVEPAGIGTGDERRSVWGRYQFSVTYSAHYPNADELARNIGIDLWHGKLQSSNLTLDFEPPTAQGSIEGTVVGSSGSPLAGMLATLSNEEGDPLNQLRTDEQGSFSFMHLVWGRYWIAVRQPGAPHDTTVFRHADLSAAGPHATIRLMMLPVEVNEATQLLHKPVVFHVVDNSGRPLAGVKLATLWSTGTVIANAKAETNEEGFAAMRLIPGRNFVTLDRHGCSKEERRADVTSGSGVDGFEFVDDCSQK